jgi:hypothetical protein
MMNPYSTEEVARAIRKEREAQAAAQAIAKQVPSHPSPLTYAALASIAMGLLSSLAIFLRSS